MPQQRLARMKMGALLLWASAIVLGACAALFNDWHLADAATVLAIVALAVDMRRLTTDAVQRVIRAVSLFHEDAPPPR